MKPAEVQNHLTSARSELERVCKLLESPSPATLDRCAASMERVIAELEAGRSWIAQAGESGVAEARRLRAVVQRVRALLDLAANYHAQWRGILAAMSGGYTVWGAPAPIRAQSRLSIRG